MIPDAGGRLYRGLAMSMPALPKIRQILVVDDNQAMTASLASLLASDGFAVTAVTNATDALAFIQDNHPIAAIIDIHLPDLSGLILSQIVRQHVGQTTPIIIVSGDASMETLNSLPHVGATYFFSKPVNPPMLLDRLHDLVNQSGRGTTDIMLNE